VHNERIRAADYAFFDVSFTEFAHRGGATYEPNLFARTACTHSGAWLAKAVESPSAIEQAAVACPIYAQYSAQLPSLGLFGVSLSFHARKPPTQSVTRFSSSKLGM